MQSTPDINFAITMTRTFSVLALSGFVDTLRHSADDDNRNRQIYCGWKIVGPNMLSITSSAGISIQPETIFSEMTDPDYLVVIGGLMPFIDDIPVETLEYIRAYYARGGTVVGLCTGSFILAQAGLLEERNVVIHHRHQRDFLARYRVGQISSRDLFIEDNRIITCTGGIASIDLAINLLTRKLGRQRALKGLVEMSMASARGPFEMARTPLESYDSCSDERVQRAIFYMRENLRKTISVAEVAESVSISSSQLNRLFYRFTGGSPSKYRMQMRLEQARWRLLNTSLSITQVAYECGFSDSPHFTRVFSKRYAVTPGKFRKIRLTGSAD